ncbi:hypothetical protein AVEN_118672-1 [Araneus ventricosus]|uniref:DUF4817 domain-containing protein n=1 Tax=Araneus ventricosus TaxID=182803 RepID=A0A4Y2AYZ4_ARAVE|nr:hypothetical protein AVEN_118672-1 [Araneus ventricosus]
MLLAYGAADCSGPAAQRLYAERYPMRRTPSHNFSQGCTGVLFTDEASFTREGVFNTHNAHFRAVENLHATRPRAAQSRFSVNVWTGIVGNHLIGPHLMPFCLPSRNYLDVRFGQQWIGLGGPVRWPARSPDLSYLHFLLWGHMKTLDYDTPVDNAEELVA